MAQYKLNSQIADAAQYGLTENDFLAAHRDIKRCGADVIAWNRAADAAADALVATAQARTAKAAAPKPALATLSQVDYIVTLLARRHQHGDGDGFMIGPTSRSEIAQMTRQDASAYISSLTGAY